MNIGEDGSRRLRTPRTAPLRILFARRADRNSERRSESLARHGRPRTQRVQLENWMREQPRFSPPGNLLQLVLATGAFAACFSVFGSVSAMMPIIKQRMHLGPVQVSIALAIPVLLGSLGRIPLGMLTDRLGGRVVFMAVMAVSATAELLMGRVDSFGNLVACGFLIGTALAVFSVGVGFTSGWYPPARQGLALGVYGSGIIGQSLASFGAPVLASSFGYGWGFWTYGAITLVWLILFALLARDAPRADPPKAMSEFSQPLRDWKAWVLGIYYFLTFGGFVSMVVYLPIFWTELFGLTPQDAGIRTAGFVLVATAGRPIGGALADRVGGQRILAFVFPAILFMAACLLFPNVVGFTLGVLGMAVASGVGNGAIFKLVPEYFPNSIGSVTGLVGAAGGLGGFFPPLLLGLWKKSFGSFLPGFVLWGAFALLCFVLLRSESKTSATLTC